ncbi:MULTISPECIES: zinc-finger domain-containing protein [Pseudomonadota]|uniref:Zinc-finger domain-containing protein n=2 Tax=Bacteria TaxID=2 RepID=A0A501PMN2_9PROT|nr:zinc-finger domain-containing protein [Emcibacter nanhaiensis]TPD61555.1 zinc-finger domain-containing protein [Emcibacter nanhaiensis]
MTEQTQVAATSPTPAHEIIETDKKRVACNGGGGPLGHPQVFLEMGSKTSVLCPYCSREYVLKS